MTTGDIEAMIRHVRALNDDGAAVVILVVDAIGSLSEATAYHEGATVEARRVAHAMLDGARQRGAAVGCITGAGAPSPLGCR